MCTPSQRYLQYIYTLKRRVSQQNYEKSKIIFVNLGWEDNRGLTVTPGSTVALINEMPEYERAYAEKIEEAYDDWLFDGDMDVLCAILAPKVKRIVESAMRLYRGYRINEADVISQLWDAVYQVINGYTGEEPHCVWKLLKISMWRRVKNVVRHERTKQRTFERYMKPLEHVEEDIPDPTVNVECQTVNRQLVSDILSDPSLTDDDLRLLRYIYENPDESLRTVADVLEYPYHQALHRHLAKIRQKLIQYA